MGRNEAKSPSSLTAALGLLVAFSAPLLAQTLDRDIEERARVDYVLLDVTAYDRQGRIVADLTIDDFVVFENRKKIRLQSLDRIDLRSPATAAGSPVTAIDTGGTTADGESPAPSRVLIVLDLEGVSAAQVRKTFDRLERFLVKAPNDPNIVYRLVGIDRPLMEGYDGDPAKVLGAIRAYGSGRIQMAPEESSNDLGPLETALEACRRGADLGGPSGQGRLELFNCISAELLPFLDYEEARSRETLSALETLAYSYGDAVSPVTMLLVSPGFSLHPGKAAIELATMYSDRGRPVEDLEAEREFKPPTTVNPFRNPRSLAPQLKRVLHACLSRRVTFHTFDIFNFNADLNRKSDASFGHGSARTEGAYKTFKSERNGGLADLANRSGGFFYSGSTLDPMGSVLERTRLIYTLGYPSPDGKPAKFRNIKVKCKRSGVKLSYRSGYYAKTLPLN